LNFIGTINANHLIPPQTAAQPEHAGSFEAAIPDQLIVQLGRKQRLQLFEESFHAAPVIVGAVYVFPLPQVYRQAAPAVADRGRQDPYVIFEARRVNEQGDLSAAPQLHVRKTKQGLHIALPKLLVEADLIEEILQAFELMFDIGIAQQPRGDMPQGKALVGEHYQQQLGQGLLGIFVVLRESAFENMVGLPGQIGIHNGSIIYFTVITCNIIDYRKKDHILWVMSGVRGGFDGQAWDFSPEFWGLTHKWTVGAVAAAVGLGIGILLNKSNNK